MASVQPFRFRGLKKVSTTQLKLEKAFLGKNTTHFSIETCLQNQAQVLGKLFNQSIMFKERALEFVTTQQVQESIQAEHLMLWLGVGAGSDKLLVELDRTLAYRFVELTLGSKSPSANLKRPLTPIEEGVLTYPLLTSLQALQSANWPANAPTLVFEGFAKDPKSSEAFVATEEHFLRLGLSIHLMDIRGVLRIFIPERLLASTYQPFCEQSSNKPDLTHARPILHAIGEIPLPARVELGKLDLSLKEIRSLEVGDIVLLEPHEITLTPFGPRGNVKILLGTDQFGYLRASLQGEGDQTQIKITAIHTQEHPMAHDDEFNEETLPTHEAGMSRDEDHDDNFESFEEDTEVTRIEEMSLAEEDTEDSFTAEPTPPPASRAKEIALEDDNLEQTLGLLGNAPAPLSVELGRINLNTTQVTRLRVGQVLRLNRGPHDPVKLVVNGKVLAEAELVEVDNTLGVRLLTLPAEH